MLSEAAGRSAGGEGAQGQAEMPCSRETGSQPTAGSPGQAKQTRPASCAKTKSSGSPKPGPSRSGLPPRTSAEFTPRGLESSLEGPGCPEFTRFRHCKEASDLMSIHRSGVTGSRRTPQPGKLPIYQLKGPLSSRISAGEGYLPTSQRATEAQSSPGKAGAHGQRAYTQPQRQLFPQGAAAADTGVRTEPQRKHREAPGSLCWGHSHP